MKPIVQLRSIITNVSTVEKEIANYIISNPDRVTKMSIHELAKESYSSTSSIVRLCKNLGYSGFKEFKHALLAELMAFGDTESHLETPIMATDSISEIIEKTTGTYYVVNDIIANLNWVPSAEEIADALMKEGKVVNSFTGYAPKESIEEFIAK